MFPRVIIPVILCGGSGTRLWPLSRESYPKQYLAIGDTDKKSLLQKTQLRVKNLKNIKDPILICNEKHRFIVGEQMREINIENYSILLEPFGRNTAPAIALSALKALEDNDDPIILVLSSDHEIKNETEFLRVLKESIKYAEQNNLVTFGIIPNSPETGYGYIKASAPLNSNQINGEAIEEFLEKPKLEIAKKLITDKRYTWNSGMFMFKAKTIINEINNFYPEIIENCKESLLNSEKDLDFQRIDKNAFKKCKDISIDVAVMEKTSKGIVLPLDAGWSDIGSWKAVWDSSKKDKDGNYIEGKVISENVRNCYLRSENRLLVAIGLDDLVIVETSDAVLISKKDNSQQVKNIVQKLKEEKISEGQNHKKVYRPWGHYLSVVEEDRWQVKLIYVKPGERLSLQMHHHRAEHWIIVSGTAKIDLDNKTEVLSENQSIYIPLGSKHRLSNPGKIPLTLIEVQSGSYVGEDDIVRFEDKYGRTNLKNI